MREPENGAFEVDYSESGISGDEAALLVQTLSDWLYHESGKKQYNIRLIVEEVQDE